MGSAQAERDARALRRRMGRSARKVSRPREKEMDCRAEIEGNEDFHFLFPFQLFQSIFK
jgi:hypothetical protein